MLPVIKRGTNKLFVNGSSKSYIEIPITPLVIGIQQISSNVLNNFSLSQNYPNPFNPVTNIKFELPQSGLVTLKVFNMLGEEVAALVNQDMTAGTYKVDFDASNLATGAYFYKMTVTNSNGSFTDTKKMMLVK